MDDLLERLRAMAGSDMVPMEKAMKLLLEAADALEAAREDACVALVADIRFACGDNGKRMQPELVEFIRGLAADAERLDWLASEARMLSGWRETGRWEMPAIQIDSARDRCLPDDLLAAIDAERKEARNG